MNVAARAGSFDELRAIVTGACEAHAPMPPLDLSSLDRILAFSPDDLTVTVEAGITVGALQRVLSEAGQWLPLDPPHPDTTCVADVLQFDISGPRRYGYGTIREHVLGLAAVTGDGRLVRSGGKVVKNVAGYDMARLFIGDQRTLGVVAEVTFKLMPQPAAEHLICLGEATLGAIDARIEAIVSGPTTPVLMDLHNLDREGAAWTLVVGYAGHPDDVAWQVARHDAAWRPVKDTDYETRFWADRPFASATRTSVLPSSLVATLTTRGDAGDTVCRAGNGVIYAFDGHHAHRDPLAATTPAVAALARRLADTFDPHGVFRPGGRS